MAFVLEDVIEELKRSRSLEPIKKLKKKNLGEVRCPFSKNASCWCNKSPYS